MKSPEDARRMAESLVERGVAAGASAADALYVVERSSGVQVRLGETESVSRSEGEEIGLRLFVGQRSATVASSDLSDEALGVLAERCLAMAREAPEDPYAGLAPAHLLQSGDPPFLDMDDPVEPDPAELRARALEDHRIFAGLGPLRVQSRYRALARLSADLGGGFEVADVARAMAGIIALHRRSLACHRDRRAAVAAGPIGAGKAARGGERERACRGARAGAARIGDAGDRKRGKYPVIFDARIASTLLGHFSGAITGSSIARKTSFLRDRLGEAVFGPGVTIVDDPLRRRGLRSRPFDAEGVRVSRRELVSAGVLNQWIADSAAARQLGIEPTGHASRGVGGAPGASPSNLYMEAGRPLSREELLASVAEAVLVIELIGQGVNGVTGDYSRGAVGFMVRGG
jgi:PmbA protein